MSTDSVSNLSILQFIFSILICLLLLISIDVLGSLFFSSKNWHSSSRYLILLVVGSFTYNIHSEFFSQTRNTYLRLTFPPFMKYYCMYMFELESRAYKKRLEDIEYIAITSDIWSSDSNKSFITVTAHFIQNVKLHSFVISTSEILENHTAENIANAIQLVLDDWKIDSKIVCIVTDNAAPMKKAISEILNKRNHLCVAHTLNLAVKDCIDKERADLEMNLDNSQILQVLKMCRSIVSHFKHSSKSSYALLDMQKQMNMDLLKVKQDVRTRWNSTFYMLERLIKLKVPLSAVLPTLNLPPSNLESHEWLLAEEMVALLHPFEQVTVILSGEKYPSLSSVVPLLFGLRKAVNSKTPLTESDKFLQQILDNVVEKRLGIYENNRTAAIATFLDPRFKKRAFLLESNAKNAQMWVINELQDIISVSTNTLHLREQPSTSTATVSELTCSDDDIWAVVDKKITTLNKKCTPYSSAAMIVKQYVEMPYLDRKKDPLQFWSEKESLFPALFKMAKKYLCIPATSVPSERLFSKAGILCNERRNRLAPKRVNQILFLNTIQ